MGNIVTAGTHEVKLISGNNLKVGSISFGGNENFSNKTF